LAGAEQLPPGADRLSAEPPLADSVRRPDQPDATLAPAEPGAASHEPRDPAPSGNHFDPPRRFHSRRTRPATPAGRAWYGRHYVRPHGRAEPPFSSVGLEQRTEQLHERVAQLPCGPYAAHA